MCSCSSYLSSPPTAVHGTQHGPREKTSLSQMQALHSSRCYEDLVAEALQIALWELATAARRLLEVHEALRRQVAALVEDGGEAGELRRL